jgi:hypothetical protein
MRDLDNVVVETSIRAMFKKSFFDICTIDRCMDILNIKKDKDIYPKLHALHCVHFADMPSDLFANLTPMIKQLFNDRRRVVQEFSLEDNSSSFSNRSSDRVFEQEPVLSGGEGLRRQPELKIVKDVKPTLIDLPKRVLQYISQKG